MFLEIQVEKMHGSWWIVYPAAGSLFIKYFSDVLDAHQIEQFFDACGIAVM
jgi:hypothetical protein